MPCPELKDCPEIPSLTLACGGEAIACDNNENQGGLTPQTVEDDGKATITEALAVASR